MDWGWRGRGRVEPWEGCLGGYVPVAEVSGKERSLVLEE